jgi:hypothetical protein
MAPVNEPVAESGSRRIAYFEVTVGRSRWLQSETRDEEHFERDEEHFEPKDFDDQLREYFDKRRSTLENDIRRGTDISFEGNVRADISYRDGSLIIEVVLVAYAAAQAFKGVVELLTWYRDFLDKVTERAFGDWPGGPDLAIYTTALPISPLITAEAPAVAPAVTGGVADLATEVAMSASVRHLRYTFGFAAFAVSLVFMAFVLWLFWG